MEPHATTAHWDGDRLTVYDSTQGVDAGAGGAGAAVRARRPTTCAWCRPHVGGGFGSQGHAPPAWWSRRRWRRGSSDRPVKLAATRRQMFAFTGYRTPTIQRIRLGADARRPAHRHRARGGRADRRPSRSSPEQTAVCTRMMYAAPNRRTTHRLARLDVPTPSWMRAPGECPGMFALESAMDELAVADRHRPGGAADPQRARRRPGVGAPVLEPQPGRRA